MSSDRTWAATYDDPEYRRFEDSTLGRLQRYFPRHGRILGDTQLRLVIRNGTRRAVRHGFTRRRCVRSYIDLMCLLGSGFDRDVLMPWAAAALGARDAPEVVRADRLHALAWRYVGRIAKDYRDDQGTPTTQRFVEEIRRLRQEGRGTLERAQHADFTADLASDLKRVFPAKCRLVRESAVRALIARAVARSARYGITSQRGVRIFAAHMFVLGGGFDRDLLLPWVSAVLRDPKPANQDERADRLLSESVTALRTWWDSAEH